MGIIKRNREQLGYTQQELSNRTGLSLRTIQRLESSNKIPKGHTLIVLAEVFKMEPSALQEQIKSFEQTEILETEYIRLINLSILSFFGIPFGNVIFPIILWKRKRTSKIVDEIGRRIINFQILWSAILCLLLCITPFVNISFVELPLILLVLFVAMTINIIVVIATAMKLKNENFDFLNLPIRFI